MLVEDFHYGAVAVAQRIEELAPQRLILVGAEQRGRPPGTVERRRVSKLALQDAQRAVEEAVTGYVSIDIALRVADGLGVLPTNTVTIEAEPSTIEPSDRLSEAGELMLAEVVLLAGLEAGRVPLLRLADELRGILIVKPLEDSAALEALSELLQELKFLEDGGRWGRTFGLRDRLRLAIARGATSEGMDHMDWGLWWALIEELDRLEKVEGTAADL